MNEKTVTATQWFWFLAVMGIATRLPLLKLATAETTDGILCLTYFSPSLVQTPRFVIFPGYPILLWAGQVLGMDGIQWGRALSALAGLLFLIPLWKFSKRWVSAETAGIICLFALFSPLMWQWSLKVMTDTLFLMAFWWSLERLTRAAAQKDPKAWLQSCLWGGAAALIRPEGFLLLPWLLFYGERFTGNGRWLRRAVVLLTWAVPASFLAARFPTLLLAYREGLGLAGGASEVQHPIANFLEHAFAYFTQPIFVFTPFLFLISLAGLRRMLRREDGEGDVFRGVLIPLYLLLLVSRLIPTTYQDRHLLPFLPLFVVGAGFEVECFFRERLKKWGDLKVLLTKNALLCLVLVLQVFFSFSALLYQRDSFGDIRRSAEFVKSLPPGAVLYSDEVPKTQYWSGREIRPITYPFEPSPGVYVILHSFYTNRLLFVSGHLRDKYGAQIIYENHSQVMPLLTDVMEDLSLQNRPRATSHRFEWQFFRSVVYEIPIKKAN